MDLTYGGYSMAYQVSVEEMADSRAWFDILLNPVEAS